MGGLNELSRHVVDGHVFIMCPVIGVGYLWNCGDINMSGFKGGVGQWKYCIRNNNDMMMTFHGVMIGNTFVDIPTANNRCDSMLISAAPELLDALQDIVKGHENEHEYEYARAAISKALGQ